MAWSTTAVAGIWVTCVAALFLAVGFAIPFWFGRSFSVTVDKTNKTYNTYVGVWYAMICEKGQADSCHTEPLQPKWNGTSRDIDGNSRDLIFQSTKYVFEHLDYWWAIQIVTTVGLGLVLLATLILICCRCAGIHSKFFFVISAILLFFGGVISLAIAILAAIGIGTVFTFRRIVNGETFPWSVLIFGLGGLLAVIASLIIMVVTCKWRRLGKYYESDNESFADDGQQMSQLSKSYDRPRKYESRYDDRRYDQSRDFSSSKKYRDGKDYSSRDYYPSRDYDHVQSSGFDKGYDKGYEKSNEGNYNKGYVSPGGYEAYTTGNGYSMSRSGDNIYRPYSQYRY